MPKKTRKRFTAQEEVAILRLHLLEHTPVSDLCDRQGIHPTMFYRWQKEFFEDAAAAFESRPRRASDDKDRKIAALRGGGADRARTVRAARREWPFGVGQGVAAADRLGRARRGHEREQARIPRAGGGPHRHPGTLLYRRR